MPSHLYIPKYQATFRITNPDLTEQVPATSLSVAFDSRQSDTNEYYERDLDVVHYDLTLDNAYTADEHRELEYNYMISSLFRKEWRTLVASLHATRCSYLEVNLQNCFCPCHCTSLVLPVVELLAAFPDDGPAKIRLLGVSDAGIRRQIREIIQAEQVVAGRDSEVSFAATLWDFDHDGTSLWNSVDDVVDDPDDGSGEEAEQSA